jgi:hypothetical protein
MSFKNAYAKKSSVPFVLTLKAAQYLFNPLKHLLALDFELFWFGGLLT